MGVEGPVRPPQPPQVQPSPIYPGGYRRPLPPRRRLMDEEEPAVEEISSDDSFWNELERIETQRVSVSNLEDAPKHEDSEESVAQERAEEEEVQQSSQAAQDEGDEVDDMGIDGDEEKMTTDTGEFHTEEEDVGGESEGNERKRAEAEEESVHEVDGEDAAEAEEERFQEERKRKGKEKALPVKKKKKVSRPASRTVVIRETSAATLEPSDSDSSSDSDVSYYATEEDQGEDSATSLVDSEEERELISYDGMEVEIEQKDVEAWQEGQDHRRFRMHQMVHFPFLELLGIKLEFVHAL